MKKIILLLLILLLYLPTAFGIDNTVIEPSCLRPSFASGRIITYTNNSVNGDVWDYDVDTTGTFVNGIRRLYNASSPISCAVEDRSSGAITPPIFFILENGKIGYTATVTPVDIGAGNYVLISTLSSTTEIVKLDVDSEGNLYAFTSPTSIYKFIKASGYSQQLFHTIVASDVNITVLANLKIQDIRIDSSDRLHVLAGGDAGASGNLTHFVLNTAGTTIHTNKGLRQHSGTTSLYFPSASMIIDLNNQLTNITYIYQTEVDNIVRLYHTGTTGGTDAETPSYVDVGGGSLPGYGVADPLDTAFSSNVFYVSAQLEDRVRTYSPLFSGYVPGSSFNAPAELTYTRATIGFDNADYYNNSNLKTGVIVSVSFDGDFVFKYRQKLFDPNNIPINQFTSDVIQKTNWYCIPISGLVSCDYYYTTATTWTPPTGNWTNGTYTAKLYEVNSTSGVEALLATTTTNILNTSTPTISPPSSEPPSETTNEKVNKAVSLMESDIFWAFIIIVGSMLAVSVEVRRSGADAFIPSIGIGFFGVLVFCVIGWIPLWIGFALLMFILVVFAWQQANKTNIGGTQ